MMYSAPIAFDGLSLQSRTLGIGSESLDCTVRGQLEIQDSRQEDKSYNMPLLQLQSWSLA